MEEKGRTIFLPKGHFFSLWLTHRDHLKGSLKYHSSTHSAEAPTRGGQLGAFLQAETWPCVSLDIIFPPQDRTRT